MGLLTPLAIRIGRVSWLPRTRPVIVRIDLGLQRLSRGRITLLDIAGLPNLTLTVVGRHSGRLRSTPLLCVQTAGGYLVAGSNFGDPAEPEWARNLEVVLRGTLRSKGVTMPFTARLLAGDEREALWQRMVRLWPNFTHYQEHISRQIKVFELCPESACHT